MLSVIHIDKGKALDFFGNVALFNTGEESMALLDEILELAADMDEWQRDALRRIFVNRTLTKADVEELINLVKEAYGCGPKSEVRPIPLDAIHLPQRDATGTIDLLGIRNLQNVNRFPDGRELSLEPRCLNVLFGENGAGKSGYARVLKNACRARYKTEVLPNAFESIQPRPTPSAEILFMEDGNPQLFQWIQGQTVNTFLPKVSVYDSACGIDYLTKEGASDYQPFGLPQISKLIATQRDIQSQIGRERDAISVESNAFNDLSGGHEVGRLIERLRNDLDTTRLVELAKLSDESARRIEELERVLGTMNPEPDARRAEQLARRLDNSVASARNGQRYVTDAALDEIKTRHDRMRTTQQARLLAQQQLHQDEQGADSALLSGTGNDVWKELFLSAARFSTQHAYIGHDHPYVGDDAKCVLCQTALSIEAKSKLAKFASYVANEASRNAEDAAETMARTMTQIDEANFAPFDEITSQQLQEIDAELADFSTQTVTRWGIRREWVKNAVDSGNWEIQRPALLEGNSLHERLSVKANQLRTYAQELRASLDADQKLKLENERVELLARQRLAGRIQDLLAYVERVRCHKKFSDCYIQLDTRGISAKATKLATMHVTNELAKNLNFELAALGFRGTVEAAFSGRTELGQTLVCLKVKNCENDIHQILSEGEQRLFGLALFLTEINLQEHKSAIVFDDPTSSLDHHHRRSIASRIVNLSRERQVIVFTHDTVFLAELSRSIRLSNLRAATLTVGWDGKQPGHVIPGLTWETADCLTRLKQVQVIAKEIESEAGDYLSEKLKDRTKDCYSKLRGTIERATREMYMNETLLPFSDEVSVSKFGAVFQQSPEDWEKLMVIYDRCCEATDAHDTNAEHQLPIPDPRQLISDVEAMDNLLQSAKKAKGVFNKERGYKNQLSKKLF